MGVFDSYQELLAHRIFISLVNVIAVVGIAMGHNQYFSGNCPSVGNIICRIMKIFERLENPNN